jgi:hypothetical protein
MSAAVNETHNPYIAAQGGEGERGGGRGTKNMAHYIKPFTLEVKSFFIEKPCMKWRVCCTRIESFLILYIHAHICK